MTKKGKRSPFPRPSLPQPGESLGDLALDLFFDRFFLYFMMGMALAFVAWLEWIATWTGQRVSPWFWTALAVVLLALSGWRFLRIRPQLENLRQGIRGEREVGRMLEDLRALGYKVFHDIPGEGSGGRKFNVDHALIGPGGVFAIETKTWSMPHGRKAVIDYDGSAVVVDGRKPDRDPIAQAEASADFLRDLLKRTTDRDVHVRPVVLFPGWWINQRARDCRTWVLNPKALQAFLRNEPDRLAREDVALYANRLEQHCVAEP